MITTSDHLERGYMNRDTRENIHRSQMESKENNAENTRERERHGMEIFL